MRRLTNYGKRVLQRTMAVAAGLVMLTGATIVVTDRAAWILMGQQAFNLLYVALVMPVTFSILAHVAYEEYDKKHRDSIQDYRQY